MESCLECPVGFGSNAIDNTVVPADFNYAGSKWDPLQELDDDDDWGDTAEEIMDKAGKKSTSGFFIFVLILVLLAYIFRKKERRMG